MAKKKLQIFISSTYLDLEEERQAAVEAILGSKHIPAGMELFRAGNTSQWDAIKGWINESDIYMLILGGRYGSIEIQSGKSYTQLEYEYAIERGIPVFAVVLTDQFLFKKAVDITKEKVFEIENTDAYNEFKKFVETKIVRYVDDCKDIQIAIKDSISELEDQYRLVGWVRSSEMDDYTSLIRENNNLIKNNNNLEKDNDRLKNQIKKVKESSGNDIENILQERKGNRVCLIMELLDVSILTKEERKEIKKYIADSIADKKQIISACSYSGYSYAEDDNYIHATFDGFWISNQARNYLADETKKLIVDWLKQYSYDINCEIKTEMIW
ncbi:MAG: hypothetical protein K0R54_4781 [Clostridiaceae bacterium]|nr:hypothetical protein [Clostridiaceae bacterium]